MSFISTILQKANNSKNHMDQNHNTDHFDSSWGCPWRQQDHLNQLQYIVYPIVCILNRDLVDGAWSDLVHPDQNLLHQNLFLSVHPKTKVKLLKNKYFDCSYLWTYELIREHTCLANLTLGRLDLIIHSPCPGWSPGSTTGFRSAFKWSKPSLAPFFESWWHPPMTSVAFLLDIYFRRIYNSFPFSSATIENCTFHNFSIIITKRDFSIELFPSHFLISILF